ncbi:MAG: hypothetical protein HZC29_06400 [Thaumarchaeota archaeon]|nr:hypothetical protein [Nitrososphaerota archaeon]
MNTQNMKKTSIIAVLAIASIALVVGRSQTQNTTAQSAPTGNNVYVFAEGVNPQATFKFRDQTVTYDFQLYDMSNNLFGTTASGFNARQQAPEFTLVRIVGDTPYLHKAVDESFENNGRTSMQDFPYKQFDVTVNMIQAGQSLRTMDYKDCSISNYKVNTRTDNEEAYTTGGKTGFAVAETYTFICTGFTPVSPLYDAIIKEQQNRKPY